MAARFAPMGLALALGLAGCGTRDLPYRFRAPVLSGVHAPDLPGRSAHTTVAGRETSSLPDTTMASAGTSLPAPHRDDTAAFVMHDRMELTATHDGSVAGTLRAMVGQRDPQRDSFAFALGSLDAIGVSLPDDARAQATAADLVAFAESRDALSREAPLPGDLVIFDEVDDGTSASLVGVVVGNSHDDTVEFVYLARQVVRRGYVTPGQPSTKRDSTGRALNTFVRPDVSRTPRGARFLAGELLRGYVRIDKLAR